MYFVDSLQIPPDNARSQGMENNWHCLIFDLPSDEWLNHFHRG